MKSNLNDIYKTILIGCVNSIDMSDILDSPFIYTNTIDDIFVKVTGCVYGDEITYQRGIR